MPALVSKAETYCLQTSVPLSTRYIISKEQSLYIIHQTEQV